MSFVTILHVASPGAVAAKRLYPDGSTAAKIKPGTYFRVEERAVNNIHDLGACLLDLASNHRAFIVRGRLKADLDQQQQHRRLSTNFDDIPLHWLCLDFDEVETPEPLSPTSPEAAVWLIESKLPKAFHGSAFILQQSSSAGTLKAGRRSKAHLWFWLEQSRSSLELRGWAKSVGADAALFQAVQPHYTAEPLWTSC